MLNILQKEPPGDYIDNTIVRFLDEIRWGYTMLLNSTLKSMKLLYYQGYI
jgi:hypothetical protein